MFAAVTNAPPLSSSAPALADVPAPSAGLVHSGTRRATVAGLVSAAGLRATAPGSGFGLEFGAAVVAAGPAGAPAACGAPPEAVEAAQSSLPHLDPFRETKIIFI